MAFKQLKLWFDKDLAKSLGKKIKAVDSKFKTEAFVKSVVPQLKPLELKDRVTVFADELNNHLNGTYKSGVKVLIKILGPENEEETGMFKEFYWVMPIAKYVEKYGLNDFELSMHAIEEITKRNTSEYAIRPYLEQETKKTLKRMKEWSTDENKHIRRLASEGVRPRLPWANKLDAFIKNPKPIIPILNNLKDDPSKYVQKSVANCINDILKDNPEIGKGIIEKWNVKNISKERKWVIKHALRNLVKADDKWAKAQIK